MAHPPMPPTTVLKPTIKDQKVSDGAIPRNPLNSWNNPPIISLWNYPAPKHQPRHISGHPLIFWGGPNSACGVCFSLNKSTSYLSLHLWILSGRQSKNLKFTGTYWQSQKNSGSLSLSAPSCWRRCLTLRHFSRTLAGSVRSPLFPLSSLTLLGRGEQKPPRPVPPLPPGLPLLTVLAHRERWGVSSRPHSRSGPATQALCPLGLP